MKLKVQLLLKALYLESGFNLSNEVSLKCKNTQLERSTLRLRIDLEFVNLWGGKQFEEKAKHIDYVRKMT